MYLYSNFTTYVIKTLRFLIEILQFLKSMSKYRFIIYRKFYFVFLSIQI